MGSKAAKAGKWHAVFEKYSSGVKTSRDAWVYNSSVDKLSENMQTHINYCNSQNWERPVFNPKKAKFERESIKHLKRLGKQEFKKNKIRDAYFRPFFKQKMYFDKVFNAQPYQIPKFFPKTDSKNLVI